MSLCTHRCWQGFDRNIQVHKQYLEMHLDCRLSFNIHVDTITKRAKSTRVFLSCNISHCNQKVKEAACTTFIWPTEEYASSAWDTHMQWNTKKLNTNKWSKVQHALSLITTMEQAVSPPCYKHYTGHLSRHRRMLSHLPMLYKIRFGLVDIPWEQHLTPLSTTTRGYPSRFMVPHTNISA